MSAADSRVAFLRLRIETNRKDAQESLKVLDDLKKGYSTLGELLLDTRKQVVSSTQVIGKMNKEFAELGRQKAIEQIVADFRELPPELGGTRHSLKLVAEQLELIGASDIEIKQVARALATVGNEAARVKSLQGGRFDVGQLGSAGRLTGGIRQLAGVAGFGGAGQALGVAADVAELTEELPRLKQAVLGIPQAVGAMAEGLGTTTPRLLALGVGIAAVSVGFELLRRQAEEARQAAATVIDGALNYYTLINTKTKEQIADELKAATTENQIAQQRFKAVSDLLFAMQDEIATTGKVSNATIQLGASLGIAAGELTAVQQAFDKELDTLNKSQAAVLALERALGSAEVAARSLAEAMDRFVNLEIATLNAALGMSGEQAKERLKNIENEIAAIERFNNSAGQSQENIDANNARLEALRNERQLLADLIPTVIAHNDALAHEQKQREDTIKAVEKFNTEYQKIEQQALDARQAAHEKYQDTLISIAERAAEAAADALRRLEEKRASLALELSRDATDEQLQLQRDELDAQIRFAREEEKSARELANNLKRIRREGARDELNAVADRDAVALEAAQTRTKDAVKAEIERHDEERLEREIAYRFLLQDQAKQFNRERADRLTKYQRDLQDAQAAYTADLNLANQKRKADLVAARNQYDKETQLIAAKTAQQLTALNSGIKQELNLISLGWLERLKIDQLYTQKLIAQAAALQGQSATYTGGLPTSPGFGGSKPYLTPPQLHSGGHILRGGLAVLDAGETVIPARGRGSGMTLNINLNGATMKTVTAISKQQAMNAVGIALDELMVS